MKKYKIFYLFFLICPIILLLNFTNNNIRKYNDLVQISIKSNKSIYLESEPIWLELEVNLDKNLKLDKTPIISAFGDNDYILTDESSNVISHTVWQYDIIKTKIHHAEHYYLISDILMIYGDYENYKNSQLAKRFKLKAGTYYLKATLPLYINNKIENFYSNEIKLTIEKPTNSEEEAQIKLLEIENFSTNFYSESLLEKCDSLKRKVNEFDISFENSVYKEKVCDIETINSLFSPNLQDTLSSYLIRIVKNNPQNYYNDKYISYIDSYLEKQPKVFEKVMADFIGDYKGTLLEKIVKNYLEKKDYYNSVYKK